MKNVKVFNIEGNNGPVKNQFIIETENGRYFQSYQSVIAFRPYGNEKIQLDSQFWDYSRTTGRYRNIFLRENKAETLKKIDAGVYELTDLNK
jgi:hypothetical protein